MTKKKALSSLVKGKQNAKKIRDWLKAEPTVPIYHGKINKTAICRMHAVPKSTIDTNDELEELFSIDGPIEKLAAKQRKKTTELEENFTEQTASEIPKETQTGNVKQIKALQMKLNSIILDLASEEFLISTGRYIPRLYDEPESS